MSRRASFSSRGHVFFLTDIFALLLQNTKLLLSLIVRGEIPLKGTFCEFCVLGIFKTDF
jgi:hypothetical protein